MTETQQRVRDIFVGLTNALVEGPDIDEFFEQLAVGTAEMFEVAGCGVLLVDQRAGLAPLAGSNSTVDRILRAEAAHDEGPGIDSVRSGEHTYVEFADVQGRWPAVAPLALEVGFVGASAVPMRLGRHWVGALTMYTDRAEDPDGRLRSPYERQLQRAVANTASLGLVMQRAQRSESLADQLQTALHSRVSIEQAKGVLAERMNVSVDEAFAMLRGYARSNGRRLTDVAAAVADGSLTLPTTPTDRAGPPTNRGRAR